MLSIIVKFGQPVSNELLKVIIVCMTHLSCLFDTDLLRCCASIQPKSQQRDDAAGTDVMHAILFHNVRHIYEIL